MTFVGTIAAASLLTSLVLSLLEARDKDNRMGRSLPEPWEQAPISSGKEAHWAKARAVSSGAL